MIGFGTKNVNEDLNNGEFFNNNVIAGEADIQKERDIYSLDVKNLKGQYKFACVKNQNSSSKNVTLHVYNLWLEK